MLYTSQDVKDAYFAHRCQVVAQGEDSSSEAEAIIGVESYDEFGKLDEKATAEYRNAELARLRRGQEILKQARLVIGRRRRQYTTNPNPLISPNAPTIEVSAGYTATQPHICEVTLMIGGNEYLTPAELAEMTSTHESTWRNKAARGELRGALKKGKQWLIPISAIANEV